MRLSVFLDPRTHTSGYTGEAPLVGVVPNQGGLRCPVWKNPQAATMTEARSCPRRGAERMNGVLRGSDIFVWQSESLHHGAFSRLTGVDGVRVRLQPSSVHVQNKMLDFPVEFPWIFSDARVASRMNMGQRREVAAGWLRRSRAIAGLYPAGFETFWFA